MQELYIQIDEENNVIGHPILKSNLSYIYGEEIPVNYVPFTKALPITLDLFEVDLGNSYQYIDGNVIEVTNIRIMTDEEKETLIDKIKEDFYKHTGFNSWVFSSEEKIMIPPIPYPGSPESKYVYEWDEGTVSWQQIIRETRT